MPKQELKPEAIEFWPVFCAQIGCEAGRNTGWSQEWAQSFAAAFAAHILEGRDATEHHFLKYHDPRSEYYLGGECVNCPFGEIDREREAARAQVQNAQQRQMEAAKDNGMKCSHRRLLCPNCGITIDNPVSAAPDPPSTPGPATEQLAQRFHETYERLAPQFGYETRGESAKPWEDVPEQNRNLMVAVCAEILAQPSTPGAHKEVWKIAVLNEAGTLEEWRGGLDGEIYLCEETPAGWLCTLITVRSSLPSLRDYQCDCVVRWLSDSGKVQEYVCDYTDGTHDRWIVYEQSPGKWMCVERSELESIPTPPRAKANSLLQPHGPVSERFMRQHYGASGFIPEAERLRVQAGNIGTNGRVPFWVIERFEEGKSQGYWNGNSSRDFSPDIEQAIQFVRKDDAVHIRRNWHWRDVEVTEHAHLAHPLTPGTPKPNDVLEAHWYHRFNLRAGCGCGWGSTLCTDHEGWKMWCEHVAEFFAPTGEEGR